jgi:hypothetical protein
LYKVERIIESRKRQDMVGSFWYLYKLWWYALMTIHSYWNCIKFWMFLREYLIKWVGYSFWQSSWEPESNLNEVFRA